MKKLLTTICAVTLLATTNGCKTDSSGKTVPDIDRIALVTREAATIGTQEALTLHPEWKTKFIVVEQELATLESQQTITVEQVLNIVSELPVNKLKSQNAQIAISSARLIVAAAGWSTVDIVRADQLRPIIGALRDGLRAGGAVP